MHHSSVCDSDSLLKPLELGNLRVFLYFLVPKKPRLFTLGNQLSLFHAISTLFTKFLKTRRILGGRVEDVVKGVMGAFHMGKVG